MVNEVCFRDTMLLLHGKSFNINHQFIEYRKRYMIISVKAGKEFTDIQHLYVIKIFYLIMNGIALY